MSSVGGDSATGQPGPLPPTVSSATASTGSAPGSGSVANALGLPQTGVAATLGASGHGTSFKPPSSSAFVDLLDPFKKAPLKQKKKSQGSSRYRINTEQEFQQLPSFKGAFQLSFHNLCQLKSTHFIFCFVLQKQRYLRPTTSSCSSKSFVNVAPCSISWIRLPI